MKKHCSKGFWDMVEVAKSKGCKVEDKGNTIVIYARDKGKGIYIAHEGEKAIHPLRRWLNRL